MAFSGGLLVEVIAMSQSMVPWSGSDGKGRVGLAGVVNFSSISRLNFCEGFAKHFGARRAFAAPEGHAAAAGGGVFDQDAVGIDADNAPGLAAQDNAVALFGFVDEFFVEFAEADAGGVFFRGECWRQFSFAG